MIDTDSHESESPPVTPPLVCMGHDDDDDENKRAESPPSEETFEHQFDDNDTSDGNFYLIKNTLRIA